MGLQVQGMKLDHVTSLGRFQQLCHEYLLTVHEIYDFDSSFYIVSERMHTALDHVIASAAYPKEAKLASKIWQVTAAVSIQMPSVNLPVTHRSGKTFYREKGVDTRQMRLNQSN